MSRQFVLLFILFTICADCYGQKKQETDSIIVPTSLKYKNPSLLKRLFLGKNYREVWETPVKVPVFKFSESGFKIIELGGGQQTKSLQLEDKEARSWVLRTVDKEVTEALPKGLRGTLAQKVVQDMVSGAHPHAPMVVAELAKAAKIVAPYPTLYYVADDEGLNPYKHFFAGTLCILEEREPTPDRADTKNTENMFEDILEENDHLVLQREVLKARLLDMLIADWDRHADQWRWGEKDSADVKYYYPIPRDRDQAFFNSRGLLVPIARAVALKHLVGFRHKTNKIKKLNAKAWTFDRTLMNELEREEWQQIFQQFRSDLNDDVIFRSVKRLPPETYAISGKLIEEKLISRRDDMEDDLMDYYEFLSKVVTVNGTDDEEIFTLYAEGNNLAVRVTDVKGRKLYERVFDKADTKQVELNGFKGKDRFVIEENVSSRINLVIDGGEGEDSYDLKGDLKKRIFDLQSENNQFISTRRSKKELK